MSMPDHAAPQKLVYMANQIGAFFKAQDIDAAPAKIRRAPPEILGPAHAPRDRRPPRRGRRRA